jgi:hypothetical protein
MSPTLDLLPRDARCCVMRSPDADLTGERSNECGAPAEVECEFCGPMCRECRIDTHCIFSEHKIIAIAELTHTTDEYDEAINA